MNLYEYASFLAVLMRSRTNQESRPVLRLAYVGGTSQYDPSGFGETVATNRGVIVFDTDDIEAAIDWLRQG